MAVKKGLKEIAKEAFLAKVEKIVRMNKDEKARTLTVVDKAGKLVVDGVPLDIILEKVTQCRYDVRQAFAPDGKVNKLYLMKPTKEAV